MYRPGLSAGTNSITAPRRGSSSRMSCAMLNFRSFISVSFLSYWVEPNKTLCNNYGRISGVCQYADVIVFQIISFFFIFLIILFASLIYLPATAFSIGIFIKFAARTRIKDRRLAISCNKTKSGEM